MVLKVVLALKHCLYSFVKQSYSLSTFLCPLSPFPLFATRITWRSVGHFPNISLLLSSHCKGKLLIGRVGLKKLQSDFSLKERQFLQAPFSWKGLPSTQGQLIFHLSMHSIGFNA